MRDLLTEYLNEYGYEVTCAANGQDALEIYKQGHFDTKPFNIDEIKVKIERALLEQYLQGSLKDTRGIVWALIISIPVWLILGIILARVLMK